MLAHAYKIIVDHGAGGPGHDREVVYGLNATEKRFLSMLITTVKLTGTSSYEK